MMPLRGMSVFDRSKRNGGYVTGQSNRMLAQEDDAMANRMAEMGDMPADEQTAETEDVPPNLRDAADTTNTCSMCANFEERDRTCKRHSGYPVEPTETCDDFAPAGAEAEVEPAAI